MIQLEKTACKPPAASNSAGDERTSRKRAAETPAEDIDPDEDNGEHIEADVKLPRHVVQDLRADGGSGPDLQASGSQDAADPGPDADMNELSVSKEEITPMLERQLKQAFRQQGLEATSFEINEMAVCLNQMSACSVHELFKPGHMQRSCTKEQAYGLRPGFCIDLTTTNVAGESWDISSRSDREKILRLQGREKPNIVICPLPSEALQDPRSDEQTKGIMQGAQKFVIQLCRRQLEQGRHFVCEIPVHCSNCDEAAQLEKESNVRSVVIDNIVKDEVRSSPWAAKVVDAVRSGSRAAEVEQIKKYAQSYSLHRL